MHTIVALPCTPASLAGSTDSVIWPVLNKMFPVQFPDCSHRDLGHLESR